jgi:hypothetical protein
MLMEIPQVGFINNLLFILWICVFAHKQNTTHTHTHTHTHTQIYDKPTNQLLHFIYRLKEMSWTKNKNLLFMYKIIPHKLTNFIIYWPPCACVLEEVASIICIFPYHGLSSLGLKHDFSILLSLQQCIFNL